MYRIASSSASGRPSRPGQSGCRASGRGHLSTYADSTLWRILHYGDFYNSYGGCSGSLQSGGFYTPADSTLYNFYTPADSTIAMADSTLCRCSFHVRSAPSGDGFLFLIRIMFMFILMFLYTIIISSSSSRSIYFVCDHGKHRNEFGCNLLLGGRSKSYTQKGLQGLRMRPFLEACSSLASHVRSTFA